MIEMRDIAVESPRMSSRQCEIAAESYAASIFSQCGYDVLVQYGANQPHYDLVINKPDSDIFIPMSVKGSQTGGWMLSAKYKKSGLTYHQATDAWLEAQRPDLTYIFIQYFGVGIGQPPRCYIAKPSEIAVQLKSQCDGRGHGALQENIKMTRPGSKYSHSIPDDWKFTYKRLVSIIG